MTIVAAMVLLFLIVGFGAGYACRVYLQYRSRLASPLTDGELDDIADMDGL